MTQETLKRYQPILELCFDLVVITNTKDKIVDTNEQLCRLLNYTKDELINKNVTKILDIERNILKSSNKTEFSIEVKTTEIDSGTQGLKIYSIKDMTEKLKMIKDKKEQEALLIQQSKTASMGEMIGAIAHQWKQPLNTVSLIIQQLGVMVENDKKLDGGKLLEIESLVMGHLEFMSQTITDFREFFKPSKLKAYFNVADTIKEISRLMNFKLRKMGVEIEIDNQENFTIYGYSNELKHVILNLITNAKDSIAESKVDDGKIKITIQKDSETTGTISIEDNGAGIPEELLPDKIFEPYFTTKNESGTGIGLSISKMIVKKHLDGDIKAYNKNRGACFVINLEISQR